MGQDQAGWAGLLFFAVRRIMLPGFLPAYTCDADKRCDSKLFNLLRVQMFQLCCSGWNLEIFFSESPGELMSARPGTGAEEPALRDFSLADLLAQPLHVNG